MVTMCSEHIDLSEQLIACFFTSHLWALTVSPNYGLVRHSGPQLIGCIADIFALVLLQGVHTITDHEEFK